jgi:hypothetical protein
MHPIDIRPALQGDAESAEVRVLLGAAIPEHQVRTAILRTLTDGLGLLATDNLALSPRWADCCVLIMQKGALTCED